ncbi:MAG: hypothetical protein P8Q14_04080, partial [Vicingaceae bacterium]|nr:hypothetical protein [Vicingaceae bacterium]
MKISKKLTLAFGLIIIILIGEIVLNQLISRRANSSFNKLTLEIDPSNQLLEKYRGINKELNFLNNNRVFNNNQDNLNRTHGILDVEFPYYISETSLLKERLLPNDKRIDQIETIISHTEEIILLTKEINNVLATKGDYESLENLETANSILSNKVGSLY